MRRGLVLLLPLLACGSPAVPTVDGGVDAGPVDAGPEDAGTDAGVDAGNKAANCASVFGTGLTASFGRMDGVVTAVVTPADTQCALPNSDHVVVQVGTDAGVFRMVVNVLSSFGDPDVRFAAISAPLVGGAWAEGWHTNASVDYPTTLGMHSDGGFTPMKMPALIQRVSDELTLGQRISVFSTSSAGTFSDSTHLIHRNGGNHDGALVIDPEGASPRWLVFHFADQTF